MTAESIVALATGLATLGGLFAGAVASMIATRLTWRRDAREQADAGDKEADRVIRLLKDQRDEYQKMLTEQREEFERKLKEQDTDHRHEMDSLRNVFDARLREQDAKMDMFACEKASACVNRVRPSLPDPTI